MYLKMAWRSLLRNPALSSLVIATLAVGIGATTTMFGVIYAVFLRPLPFPDQDRLVTLWETDVEQGIGQRRLTPANFADWESRSQVIDAAGAIPNWSGPSWTFNIVGRDGVDRVQGVYASAGFFRVLGVAPLLGRTFGPDEDKRRGERKVVISHAYWLEQFAGDPSVLGKTIEVDTFRGGAFTIIGVMPPGFELPRHARVWLSLGDWGGGPMPAPGAASRCCPWYTTLARLKPGVTMERAAADLTNIAREISSRHPDSARVTGVKVVPLRDVLVGQHRLTLFGLFGAVACVLLIACANVANLLLSRGVSRRREILTRQALGATRWQIARQLMMESGLLTVIAAVAGVLVAAWMQVWLAHRFTDRIPLVEGTRLDWPVLAFAVGVTVVGGLICACTPLVEWRTLDWRSRAQTESPGSRQVRQALVVAEVALAVTLVTTAGLLVRSITNLQSVELGFAIDRTLVVSTDLTTESLRSRGSAAGLLEQVLPRLAALPGVRAVAASTGTPLEGGIASQAITREGDPVRPETQSHRVVHTAVTPGYFRLMGMTLQKGRIVSEIDTATSTLVAVINETAARRYWPHEDPVGKRFAIGSLERFGFFRAPPTPGAIEWREIVGVVSDVRSAGFAFDVQPEVYYSYKQFPIYDPAILVQTQGDPAPLAASVRHEMRSANPSAVIKEIRTLDNVASASTAEPRLRARLVTSFSLAALGLGMLGIYGLMSYTVVQQTREIGIRIALGAQRVQVARMVITRALQLTLAGVLIGSAGASAVGRWISSLLFGVQPFDAVTFVGTSVMLACAAMVASAGPAVRALRVDPIVALRND
jgi:putative ABC transport system permease protein